MTSNDGAAREFQFTSESVTEGHPDKIADQISDVVLDAVLAEDPLGRVACETLITTGLVVVAGEISTHARLDVAKLVRERIRHIGYTRAKYGFDADTCGIMVTLDEQSADIAQGVDASFEAQQRGEGDPLDHVGAGDQGMMFGYAVNETPELMPLPIVIAHRLAHRLAEVRKDGTLGYLRPDGKTQVTVRYDIDEHGHRTPVEIERVLISTQHREGVEAETIKPDLIEHVIEPILTGDYSHLLDEARLAGARLRVREPDGQLRDRRPDGRHRPDRPQDRRRHLWRRRAARRRRVLGQGSDEGRPLGRLRRALRRQERRRRGPRAPLPGAGRVRHRRRAARLDQRRVLRHGGRSPRRASRSSSASTSTCARPRSCAISTCAGRSTPRPPPTATSAAATPTSRWERTDRADALRAAAGLLPAETRARAV